MSTDFFTADHHFGHVNKKGSGIIQYSKRLFDSIEEMNETLIDKWNAKVNKGDNVYHLGDFAFGDPREYIQKLNGFIHFILGDHDKDLENLSERTIGNFKIHSDRIFRRNFNKNDITLCHWNMRVWPRSHYNSWHLYAHSHGNLPPVGKAWDVGVDNNNFEPVSLDEINVIMKNRPDNFNLVRKR